MSLPDLTSRGHQLSKALNDALAEHREQSVKAAEAERTYRKTKAECWARSKGQDMLAKEREAWVDAESADERYDRDLATALAQSGRLAIEARRAQISLLQSELAAHRAEAELAGIA